MTDEAQSPSRGPRFARLLVLTSILIMLAVGLYWYRIYSPAQLHKEAIRRSQTDPAQAIVLLDRATARSSKTPPEWQFFRMQMLVTLGRWEEALGQWTQIKEPQLLPAEKLCQLGYIAQQHQQFALAENLFQAAKYDSVLLPNILRSLIQIHLKLGQNELAIQESRQLLEMMPNDPTAWQVLGTVYLSQKDFTEAESALRQCLLYSINTQQITSVREDLIQTLIDTGQFDKAKQEMNLLSQSGESLSERAMLLNAWLLRTNGQFAEGLKVVEEYRQNHGHLSQKAILMRGMLLLDSSQLENAMADFRMVTSKEPWNKEAHQQLAVVLMRLKHPEEAEKHRLIAEKLNNDSLELMKMTNQLRKNPGNRQLRERMSELYLRLGKPDLAQQILQSGPSQQRYDKSLP